MEGATTAIEDRPRLARHSRPALGEREATVHLGSEFEAGYSGPRQSETPAGGSAVETIARPRQEPRQHNPVHAAPHRPLENACRGPPTEIQRRFRRTVPKAACRP